MVELPPDVVLVRLDQRIGQDAAGNTIPVYRLTFKVRGFGPFALDTPVHGYTGEKGRQLMIARAAEIKATLPPPATT